MSKIVCFHLVVCKNDFYEIGNYKFQILAPNILPLSLYHLTGQSRFLSFQQGLVTCRNSLLYSPLLISSRRPRHIVTPANILRGKTSFSRVFFTSFKIKPRVFPLVNNRLFACGKRFKTSIYNRFRTHLPYNTERQYSEQKGEENRYFTGGNYDL